MITSGTLSSPETGGRAMMQCCIKDEKSKQKNNATLYKIDQDNLAEFEEITNYNNTRKIIDAYKNTIFKGITPKEVYVLVDDKTGEIISTATTTHHYRSLDEKNPGLCTLIENFCSNDEYSNAGEAMLAFIVRRAQERNDNSVYSINTPFDIPESIKRAKFIEAAIEGMSYMPSKSFFSFIDKAEKRSKINY